MALVPIFNGRVSEEAALVLFDTERTQRRAYLRTLAGKHVEIIVRKKRTQRSVDQNAYLHAVPIPMLAEEWGEDTETTKMHVLGECFGWKDTRDGHRLPVKPHTSELTTEEFSHLIEWLVIWAATPGNVCARGFTIPLPNEVAA